MNTIELGRTGARVSVVGLGCGGHSRLGMSQGASSDQAARVVDAAIDLGVTLIDTAEGYGTEDAVRIGVGARRDDVFLCTKGSIRSGDGMRAPADLGESLRGSLKRLGTDRIDAYLLHGVRADDYAYARDVLVPELFSARDEGLVRWVGLSEQFGSDTSHEMMRLCLADDWCDVAMVGCNVLNQSAVEHVFPQTRAKGIGTLLMFAVRRALSNADRLSAVLAELDVDFDQSALGMPLTDAAYRFCRHHTGADVTLTGTGSVDHLRENIAAINAPPLADDVVDLLRTTFAGVDSVAGN